MKRYTFFVVQELPFEKIESTGHLKSREYDFVGMAKQMGANINYVSHDIHAKDGKWSIVITFERTTKAERPLPSTTFKKFPV